MSEYFVRVKGEDWDGNERTLDLEPFTETDPNPDRELGIAREMGWARTCSVSPLPYSGILFKKKGEDWEEVGRVF